MREYFLEHDYTHLIICPDDLLVKPEDLEALIDDAVRFRPGSHTVVSGYCNVDSEPINRGLLNITDTKHIPHIQRSKRHYSWISNNSDYFTVKYKLFPVGYAGFALMAIKREIIEKIPFRNDGACCIDVMFCWDCAQAHIPIYVDPKIKLLHLKIKDGVYQEYQQGHKEPHMHITEV